MGAQNGIIFGTIVMNGLLYDSYVISCMTPWLPIFAFHLPGGFAHLLGRYVLGRSCQGHDPRGQNRVRQLDQWSLEALNRYGCFLKGGYPQNTPKWSFLVFGKPMGLLGKPTILGNTLICTLSLKRRNPEGKSLLWGREPHQESGAQYGLQWLPHLAGHARGEDSWGSDPYNYQI